MKITKMRTALAVVPLDPPVGLATGQLKTNGILLVWLESDQGVVGEGLCCTLNADRLALYGDMARSFEPLVAGLDLGMSGAFSTKALATARYLGNMAIVALSAIEDAILDLKAKIAGVNVSRLLGACRTSIPAYHSGDLWVTLSIDELQKAGAAHRKAGFRAMKIRLRGDRSDIERIRKLREAIGPDAVLMADLNQRLPGAKEAIRYGRELEQFNLGWLEEPLSPHDHEGEAQVTAALGMPIASGESVYTSRGICTMLKHRAADVLMPDLQRMGGPGEFMKAAALAEAHNVPVSGHLFPEMSLGLLAAIPNAQILEVMPWVSPVYKERVELDANGHAVVPDRPGWGFSFDDAAIRRFTR